MRITAINHLTLGAQVIYRSNVHKMASVLRILLSVQVKKCVL